MHRSPRPGGAAAVRIIAMHINVGPEIHAGAQSFINNVLSREDGGYHAVGDDVSTAVAANPDELVYGASGANNDGYHYCLLGNIQTAQQWDDTYSHSQLLQAAKFVAQKCHELNVPPVRLTDAQVADRTSRGICDHFAINRAIVKPAYAKNPHSPMGPGDHTDVGAAFPWDHFIGLVQAAYAPTTDPTQPKDDDMLVSCPSRTQPDPNKFRGLVFNSLTKHIALVGGATCFVGGKQVAAPTIDNPNPCLSAYLPGGAGTGRFVAITANDLDEYEFDLP